MLPYVSGIEICRRLRRDSDTRDLPIILLTLQLVSQRIKDIQATAEAAIATYINGIEEIVGTLRGPSGLLREVRTCAAQLQSLRADEISMDELHAFIDALQLTLAELNDGIEHVWFTLDAE